MIDLYEDFINKDGVVKTGAPEAIRREYFKRKLTEKYPNKVFQFQAVNKKLVMKDKVVVLCDECGSIIKSVALNTLINTDSKCECKVCK